MRFKLRNLVTLLLMMTSIFGYFVNLTYGKIVSLPKRRWNQESDYVVQNGDTLVGIAALLKTNVQAIISLNHLKNPNYIYTGERLRIPRKAVLLPSAARPVICTITAYTAGYESTGKWPGEPGYGITSTGKQAIQGVTVAVDPSVIPYGTPMYIPGVGLRIADDTGGAIIGDHVDVYYNRVQTALDFGVKHDVVIYLLPKKDITFRGEFPVLRHMQQKSVTRHPHEHVLATDRLMKPLPTHSQAIAPAPRPVPKRSVTDQKTKLDIMFALDVTLEQKLWLPFLHTL